MGNYLTEDGALAWKPDVPKKEKAETAPKAEPKAGKQKP